MNRRTAIPIVALLLSISRGARAQSSPAESALAETLYRQARQLMTDGKIAEACPKFAESHRLDPATGTLLNLAACHEAEQKYASASLEYAEAVTRAQHDRRDDRVRFAQARLAALEPKVSYIRVVLAPAGASDVIETELDGTPVRGPARNVPLPVDPGAHVVTARGPGRKAWSQRVSIGQDAMNVTVTVPSLEPDVTPSSAEPDRSLAAGTSAPVPSAVYVMGAATLAFSAGALGTGVVYVARYAQYGQVETADQASTTRGWGVANAVCTGGAVVSAGVTLYLYWTRPAAGRSVESARATPEVVPWLSPSGGGLVLQGSL